MATTAVLWTTPLRDLLQSPNNKSKPQNNKAQRKPNNAMTRLYQIPRISGMLNTANPFPSQWTGKMSYSDDITFTSGTSNVFGSEHVWFLNSLYDPDFTSTGHQPYGFDQLAALYRRYRVTRCDVDITFSSPTSNNMVAAVTCQSAHGAFSMAGKAVNAVSEKPQTWVGRVNTSGSQKIRFHASLPIAGLEGVPEATVLSNEAYSAAVTTNPNNPLYVRVAVADHDDASQALVAFVRLTYHCTFYERRTMTQS
jgi:hypothetical protein